MSFEGKAHKDVTKRIIGRINAARHIHGKYTFLSKPCKLMHVPSQIILDFESFSDMCRFVGIRPQSSSKYHFRRTGIRGDYKIHEI
jgi:hypothetical protein